MRLLPSSIQVGLGKYTSQAHLRWRDDRERTGTVVYNKVVLVVDDESHMLTLLELMLKRQGYVVMKAQDANDALKLVRSLTPNLCIIDVMMPGMNGYELCERLRAHTSTSRTPIIILSARSDPDAEILARQAGANLFLSKSSLLNGLLSEVRQLLYPEL